MRQKERDIKNVGRKLHYDNVIEEDDKDGKANILSGFFEGSSSGLASTQSNKEYRKAQYKNVIEESLPTKTTGEEFVNILANYCEDSTSGLAPTQSNVMEESSRKGSNGLDEQ